MRKEHMNDAAEGPMPPDRPIRQYPYVRHTPYDDLVGPLPSVKIEQIKMVASRNFFFFARNGKKDGGLSTEASSFVIIHPELL